MLLVTTTLENYAQEVAELINNEEPYKAATKAKHLSSRRLATILTNAPLPQVLVFIHALGWERAGRVASFLPLPFAVELLNSLDEDAAGSLLAHLFPQVAAHILPLLDPAKAGLLLDQLDTDYRQRIEELVDYAEGSAGGVMSPYFLAVEKGLTVKQAIHAIREAPSELQTAAYVYVVDASNKPVGVISLRDLLLASQTTPLEDLMTRDVLAARTDDEAIDAARRIKSRRIKMLPVVSVDDQLVGVITMDMAMDLLAQEVASDFTAVSGASVDESFFTPPRQAVRMRLPWMAANIFLNLGAVWVISSYEDIIVQVAILAAFLPMITDMGGNVGIQALSVSIRSMALGEARLRDIWKALRKELAIGVFNGCVLGVLFGVVAYVLQGSLMLSLVAGTALAMNVLVAGVVGGTIPFLIKRLGKDPAMMTGPVLTTITDITGVSIYLGLSTIFLASLLAVGG